MFLRTSNAPQAKGAGPPVYSVFLGPLTVATPLDLLSTVTNTGRVFFYGIGHASLPNQAPAPILGSPTWYDIEQTNFIR